MENCGAEHGKVLKSIETQNDCIQKLFDKVSDDLPGKIDKKLSNFVFGWFLIAIIATLGFLGGYIFRVETYAAQERKQIVTERNNIIQRYEDKLDKMIIMITQIRIDIERIAKQNK